MQHLKKKNAAKSVPVTVYRHNWPIERGLTKNKILSLTPPCAQTRVQVISNMNCGKILSSYWGAVRQTPCRSQHTVQNMMTKYTPFHHVETGCENTPKVVRFIYIIIPCIVGFKKCANQFFGYLQCALNTQNVMCAMKCLEYLLLLLYFYQDTTI